MTASALATILALMAISLGTLLVAYGITALHHDRWRRRAPQLREARTALAGLAARGAEALQSTPASRMPELTGLSRDELISVLSEVAFTVDGDSRGTLRLVAEAFGIPDSCLRDLEHPAWARRLAAARVLTALGEPVPSAVHHLFRDPSAAVRHQMTVWAACNRAIAPVDLLASLLSDPDGQCRFGAKDALVRTGPRSVEPLVKILTAAAEGTETGPVSPEAANPPAGWAGLPARLRGIPGRRSQTRVDWKDRALVTVSNALEAAAAIGDPAFTPAALKLAGSLHPRHRALAAAVLGASGGTAAAAVVRTLLHDEHPDVRRAAVRAVADQGEWSAAGTVADLLADPEWMVRREAGATLLRLGPPGLILLRDTSRGAGTAAAVAGQSLQIHALALGKNT